MLSRIMLRHFPCQEFINRPCGLRWNDSAVGVLRKVNRSVGSTYLHYQEEEWIRTIHF
jgi:hypothetical protein